MPTKEPDDQLVYLVIRIPAALRRRLKRAAAANDQTMQEVMTKLLLKWVEAQESRYSGD